MIGFHRDRFRGKNAKFGRKIIYTRQNSGGVNTQASPPAPFGGRIAGGLDLTTPEEPTESNTGYRIPTAALQDWTAPSRKFRDPGFGDNEVPATGITITGYRFQGRVEVYTSNPIHFVDCYFLDGAQRRGDMGGYLLYSNGSNTQHAGRKLKVSYCTFRGGKGPQVVSCFKKLFRCSFNYTLSDYIRFETHTDARNIHDFLVEGCWFGPLVNIRDSSQNNQSSSEGGMYNDCGSTSTGGIPDSADLDKAGCPHSDNGQVYSSDPRKITYKQCSLDWTADKWTDQTWNPNNVFGANPDKIFQLSGKQITANNPTGNPSSTDIIEFDRCWFYGSGNSWCSMRNSPPKNVLNWWTTFEIRFFSCLFALDSNGGSWSYTFDSAMNFTRVTDGLNKFMRTDSESLRLPQEALDAGSQVSYMDTNSQGDIFSCERWLLGFDAMSFSQDGLNEGGKTSFDRRSTPA